jgi:hypothetical protein
VGPSDPRLFLVIVTPPGGYAREVFSLLLSPEESLSPPVGVERGRVVLASGRLTVLIRAARLQFSVAGRDLAPASGMTFRVDALVHRAHLRASLAQIKHSYLLASASPVGPAAVDSFPYCEGGIFDPYSCSTHCGETGTECTVGCAAGYYACCECIPSAVCTCIPVRSTN